MQQEDWRWGFSVRHVDTETCEYERNTQDVELSNETQSKHRFVVRLLRQFLRYNQQVDSDTKQDSYTKTHAISNIVRDVKDGEKHDDLRHQGHDNVQEIVENHSIQFNGVLDGRESNRTTRI